MDYFSAIAPSAGLGLLFYFVIRAFLTADRKERAINAKLREEMWEKVRREAEEEAAREADK